MRMPAAYKAIRGQTSVEYLLLLAIVAVVVIGSFGPGSLVSQIHDTAQGYYNTVTRVIMGETPAPIPGGWCPLTCGPAGYGPTVMYGACECPAPAFGGAFCTGVGSAPVACGPNQSCPKAFAVNCTGSTSCSCPTGQSCGAAPITALNPDGCGCSNGLICGNGNGPTGSIPDIYCASCICPSGSTFDKANNSCDQNCTTPCTTWNGTACVPVVCGANMTCDPAQTDPTKICACNQGTYYVGPGCAYCSAPIGGQCSTSLDGQTCVGVACPSNLYCDTTVGDPFYNQCRCPSPTICWNGTTCVKPSGNGTCNCNPTTPCTGYNCGSDSCGNSCGPNCVAPATCSSNTGPGDCSCTPKTCATLGDTCGTPTDGCGGTLSCGNCTAPQACSNANGGVCSCTPKTCASLGDTCGNPSDGCGSTLSCGNCTAPQACSSPNGGTCGCTPKTCANLGFTCGNPSDGCGGTLFCGNCPSPETCSSVNGGACNCTPKTCASLGNDCGSPSNGCGSTLFCGNCTAPLACSNLSGGNCLCTPKTCAALGDNCGSPSDGCSSTLFCGNCTAPQTCSNVNGGTCGCTPKTCASLGDTCGSPSNGCGGTLFCGNCTVPQTCSNVNGGTCGCTPTTCAALGDTCGSPSNGCGGTLSCGNCTSPQTCSNVNGGTCSAPLTCPALYPTLPQWILQCGPHNTPCQNLGYTSGSCVYEYWYCGVASFNNGGTNCNYVGCDATGRCQKNICMVADGSGNCSVPTTTCSPTSYLQCGPNNCPTANTCAYVINYCGTNAGLSPCTLPGLSSWFCNQVSGCGFVGCNGGSCQDNLCISASGSCPPNP